PRRLIENLGKLTETILLTADGKSVMVGLEPEGERTYYSVPARAFAIVPLDGSTPLVLEVTGQPLKADESTLYQSAPSTFYLLRDVPGTAQREVVEVDITSGRTRRIWSGQGRFNVVGATPARDFLVSRFEGLSTTPNYYLFDRSLAIVRRLSNAEPRLKSVRFGPMESFETTLPGHDGKLQKVRTYIFLPHGAKRGDRVPTVVYFYSGSPFSRYAHDFGGGAPNSIPVQIFASRGYGVLFCDVPLGPQGKGGNPVQEMTDSVLAQVYRSGELGYSDIHRMAIMGQSYGAYSTAAIITATNIFRAAIALDGMYDLGGMYARMDRTGGSFGFIWSETGQGRMGTHPWSDLRRYIANSPYYQADKIQTPLLLIHGEKDDTCPVEEAQK
ncbi:MAG: alpha/beta hydrolase family protein, partial [Acidimicrobiia bacterium]